MKNSILLILFLAGLLSTARLKATDDKLIEATRIATISKSTMDSIRKIRHIPSRLVPVRYDVAVFDVLYQTQWWDGSPITASGFVLMPLGAEGALPVISYNHGTRLEKQKDWAFKGEEAICGYFATDGYIVSLPDYVGLRRGERNHLYHHSGTEALATVDLLRALKPLLGREGVQWNGQLFLTGYSQGGHAALATHKYIQENLKGEFKVTASAPMSGAYDLAGVQGRVLDEPYEYPGYLPYLLFSYQEVYRISPDSSAFFQAPYDTLLPRLFDGKLNFRKVNKYLPEVPADMMKPALLKAYKEDENHPLKKLMQENSLTEWAPETPVLLCFCKQDEQVSYQNSLVAFNRMKELGSEVVHKRMAGRRFKHSPCSVLTSLYARLWFDSFRKGHTQGRKGPLLNRWLVSFSKLLLPKR